MQQNTATGLQVIVIPATTAVENKIKIIFGSAVVGAGQTVTLTNLPTGSTPLPGTFTAVGSGTSILVTGLTDLTVGSTYAFNLALQGTGVGVSTPAAGTANDTIITLTSGDVVIDTDILASRYINSDQVLISGYVPPTFTFTLSGNTDAFTTNLTSGSVSTTTGISVSVATNAAKGWTAWVKSLNSSLLSVTTGEGIGTSGTLNATPEACVTSTDCYVLDVGVTSGTGGSGSATADAEYSGNGTTTGGTLSNIFQPIASRPSKTNGDTVWLRAHATMIATKAAGNDYSDTWTIVGAGNY
jgi:hypothetical protein